MICVSLSGISYEECLQAAARAEFAEVRIDLLDLTDEQFDSIFITKRNTIATCRPGKYNDAKRLELLKRAIANGAGYVDIEYEATEAYRKELLSFAKEHKTIAILSYHNFDVTPSKADLEAIIVQSQQWGADRVKIATMAKGLEDNARILGLYENYQNLIAFCMGANGVITRVSAPFLGADFTFAAINDKLATAPGQLTVEELKEIFDIIG
jgi:3-dehydroquinate dehydratase I